MSTVDLTGLTALPAQVWGAVRLVPLVRDRPIPGLRLHARLYGDDPSLVVLPDNTAYTAYIPHGFVATWSDSPAATYGTHLTPPDPTSTIRLRFHRRMARREERNRLRFLPLHLAVEGYLALHFNGPNVLWDEWSQRAIRRGLSPRAEQAYAGAQVEGLADALKIFEIHPDQCGVALYVADALAAAFVVPHPDDYRALHSTLLLDMYGELVHHYALLSAPVPAFSARLNDTHVRSLADLRAAATRQSTDWAAFHATTMTAGLLDATYDIRRVYRAGPFTLSRFLPGFRPKEENHIGELITDQRGRTAYLKTFRLSESQIRRGHLLNTLATHDWHLPTAAESLGTTPAAFGLRLDKAGFGHLLNDHVLASYRSRSRRPTP
ncbi:MULTISPECIES: ARPP-2 domain-containing protein [unclassified Saccharothrix]|uniref:ARPP-2 domain-containing protein n=1 Tax=unclassified Saccharothrix TaxID=2593673 RepID=UPI00307F18BB